MASTFNLACPGTVRILNGIVDLNRKQHRPSILALPFLLQGSLHLILDPLTLDRRRGQVSLGGLVDTDLGEVCVTLSQQMSGLSEYRHRGSASRRCFRPVDFALD